MDAPEDDPPLPPEARFLKRLVLALTVVMIAGFLLLIGTLVVNLNRPPPAVLPETLTLPEGARALAFTQGSDWLAVVTTDDRILIYDRATGALRQTITLD